MQCGLPQIIAYELIRTRAVYSPRSVKSSENSLKFTLKSENQPNTERTVSLRIDLFPNGAVQFGLGNNLAIPPLPPLPGVPPLPRPGAYPPYLFGPPPVCFLRSDLIKNPQ